MLVARRGHDVDSKENLWTFWWEEHKFFLFSKKKGLTKVRILRRTVSYGECQMEKKCWLAFMLFLMLHTFLNAGRKEKKYWIEYRFFGDRYVGLLLSKCAHFREKAYWLLVLLSIYDVFRKPSLWFCMNGHWISASRYSYVRTTTFILLRALKRDGI